MIVDGNDCLSECLWSWFRLTHWICDNLTKWLTDIIRRLKDIQWWEDSDLRPFTLCEHQRVSLFHRYSELVVFSRLHWFVCFYWVTYRLRWFVSGHRIAFFPDLSIWTTMGQNHNYPIRKSLRAFRKAAEVDFTAPSHSSPALSSTRCHSKIDRRERVNAASLIPPFFRNIQWTFNLPHPFP
jgi:hypothetical protein